MKQSPNLKTIFNTDFSYVQDEFVQQVKEYMKKHDMNQVDLCNYLGGGIDEPKVSKLLNRRAGEYGEKLKGHFLVLFVERGIIDVQGLGLKNQDVENYLLRLAPVLEDEEMISIIGEGKALGGDPKTLLRAWLKDLRASSKRTTDTEPKE
jgi:hypothetical protein